MARRNFNNTSTPTSLSASASSSTSTLAVVSTANYPTVNFTIALERGTVREELCLVTSKAPTSLTVTRGYGGTVAQAHASGSAVEHVATADDYDEANSHITLTSRDDHTQYLNAARHDETDHSSVFTAAAVAPVGVVVAFTGSTAPANWLMCNGASVSRSTYAELFAVLGSNYGAGDGASTFGLPDFRGRFPVGTDAGLLRGSDPATGSLGGAGGIDRVTLTSGQMPTHTHVAQPHTHGGTTNTAGQHFHGNSAVFGFFGPALPGYDLSPGRWYVEERAGGGWDISWGTTDTSTSHRHTFTTNSSTVALNNSGGGDSHPNMPPYQTVNYIIRAAP